jgi:hypothetical protein
MFRGSQVRRFLWFIIAVMGLFLSWVQICVGGLGGWSSICGRIGGGGCARDNCWFGMMNCRSNVLWGRCIGHGWEHCGVQVG